MIEHYNSLLKGGEVSRGDPGSSEDRVVGVIGLGLLGSALVERLIEHGFVVHGYDKQNGNTTMANLLESTRAVFERCSTVIFSLPESRDVADVLEEASDVMEPNHHTIVDTTTGDPDEMRQFYELLKKRKIRYIEANIAGSSEAARNGDTPLFLGGEKHDIETHRPLFNAMSKTSFNMGEAGEASKFKLVHNLLLGLNRAVFAEALAFGEALGFDRRETLNVLLKTPASSYVMVTKGERMVESNFKSPQARLSQHFKDVRLILDYAKRSGARTPFSEIHYSLLDELESIGYGDCDNSAILIAFQGKK